MNSTVDGIVPVKQCLPPFFIIQRIKVKPLDCLSRVLRVGAPYARLVWVLCDG